VVPHTGFLPYTADFETGIPDDVVLWEHFEERFRVATPGPCPESGNGALLLDQGLMGWPSGSRWVSPWLDLSGQTAPYLTLDRAYAQNGGLVVLRIVSKDGKTDESFFIGESSFFFEPDPEEVEAWRPDDCSDWERDTLDLEDFAGQTVVLEIRPESGHDDLYPMYMDNLKVSSETVREELESEWEAGDIELGPVPTEDEAVLRLRFYEPTDVAYELYSLDGRFIESGEDLARMGPYERAFNLRQSAAGMYLLRLSIDGEVFLKKLVRQP